MKIGFLVVVALVIGIGIGWVASGYLGNRQHSVVSGSVGEPQEREILYWVAPMDPNFRRDQPGKSPMGMDLVPVYADAADADVDTVKIDPTVVQNLGVRTERVANSPLHRTINTVGYVEYDENALQHIHTRVDGWVEKLSVKAEGDPVESGQVLFEIYSRTLVNAQQEYLMAKAAAQSALVEASKERLESLGMTANELSALDQTEQVNQRVKVFASANGVVGMLGIREGVFVTPATHVMSIADLERVWILAEVLERQADLVEVGQKATFEVDAKPGRKFHGQVEYIYPDLDPISRSLKVRIGYAGQDDVFRPNMFARVNIVVEGKRGVTHVPRSAVIRGGLSDRVVLVLGEGRFRSAPVMVGMEAGDRIEIVRGLTKADQVVVSGQFLIDSESNIEAALARFDAKSNETEGSASVAATIVAADFDKKTIRVKHGAIPAWGWRAMTMNLPVDDESLLKAAQDGDDVMLDIAKQPSGRAVITAIRAHGE